MGFGYSFPTGYAPGPVSTAPQGNALADDQAQSAAVGSGAPRYSVAPPRIMAGEQHAGTPQNALQTTDPSKAYHDYGSTAGSTLPPGPTGIENNPYIANFQKSLAASRGAIAAQIAAAMHEIGTNQAAGKADVNAFGASLGQMNADEHTSLNALAGSADKAAAAGGLQSYTSAKGTTNPLGAAGDMATHFAQGAVPLLQQGVNAQAQAQTNVLQQYGMQLNAQLDAELRGFDAQQASDIAQRNFAREQGDTQFGHQLTLAELSQQNQPGTGNPILDEHFRNQQNLLDKGGVDSFTADQVPALRQSPQYAYLKGITDPKQRALAAQQVERLGHKDVTDLARLDGLIP